MYLRKHSVITLGTGIPYLRTIIILKSEIAHFSTTCPCMANGVDPDQMPRSVLHYLHRPNCPST